MPADPAKAQRVAATRAHAAVGQLFNVVTEARRALEAQASTLFDPADPAGVEAHLVATERLQRRLDAATSAHAAAVAQAAQADAVLAAAVAAAAIEAERDEEAALDRESRILADRVGRDYPKLAASLGALIAATVENASRVTAVNARRRARGDVPITDAESRLRHAPASQVSPARYEVQTIWRDARGDPPTVCRPDGSPLHPELGGYTPHKERVVVEPERVAPAFRPEPLAKTVRLPALRRGEPPAWAPA